MVRVDMNGVMKMVEGVYGMVVVEIEVRGDEVGRGIGGRYGEEVGEMVFGRIEMVFVDMRKREVMGK